MDQTPAEDSDAGGVAIGSFTASAAVVGLIIAVLSVVVAWATSFLKPPVVEQAAEPATKPEPMLEAA